MFLWFWSLSFFRRGSLIYLKMAEGEKRVEPEFKWGMKGSLGGKKKDVQLYDSFTYDGVEYKRYDSVYLYSEGEPEPFIGKLIKIWENSDKSKKVKILWFFRPCEILNFLEGIETLENELFLASGEGLGLSNINPLEAIAGKCNVVCISKGSRNPQLSDEEIQRADFVFYRFFDVGKLKILDKLDGDKIAETEVKNIFNNINSQKPVGVVKLDLDKKEVSGNIMATNEVVALSSQNNSQPIIEKADGKCFDTSVRENFDSKPSFGEKPASSVGVKGVSKSIDKINGRDGVSKASLVKQKSSTKVSYGSRDGEMGEIAKMDDKCGTSSIEKTILRSKVDSKIGEGKVVGQSNKGLEKDKALEKEEHGVSTKVSNEKLRSNLQNRKLVSNDGDAKKIAPPSSKDKYKIERAKDFRDVEEVPSKKLKLDKKPGKLSIGKLHKESSTVSSDGVQKLDCSATEVTRRPDADRSKWFKGFPWEERMKTAYDQGTLVLLENLDPSLTSPEVEVLIWNGFKESCTAKVVQGTAFSSPHCGQAFVIFKKKDAAALVVKKLDEGCFLMSNGRPLVGSFQRPCFPEKKPVFYGHHVVDQLRMQKQREMKDAVSTSHCSQPNNIEYDMAMEWCLLQERADKAWRRLFQQQGEELRKVKAKLKPK